MIDREFTLFVPGPVEIEERIRQVGAERLPYMRTEAFSKLTFEVMDGLRRVAGTTGDVALLTASGTAAMEAAVSSLFGASDRVLVVNGGTFGQRFADLCTIHAVPHEEVRLEPGQSLDVESFAGRVRAGGFTGVLVNAHETSTGVLYDIEALGHALGRLGVLFVVDAVSTLCADPYRMDAWGVDATIFSTQKGLALPPGMAFVAMGPRARERALGAPRRSLYLHLADYLKDGSRGQTPFTVAVGIVLQLRKRLASLDVDAEVEAVAARARRFREGIAGLPLSLLPARPSNAITALRLEDGPLDAPALVRRVCDEYGYYLAPNGEPLRRNVFRVSHLGAQAPADVDRVVTALRRVLAGTTEGME